MLTDGKDAWNYYLWQDEWTSVDPENDLYAAYIYYCMYSNYLYQPGRTSEPDSIG